MQPSRQYKAWKYIIAIACIVVSGFVLLEACLRIGGFYYTYTEKMDGQYVSYYNAIRPSWYYETPRPYDSITDMKPEYNYLSLTNNYGYRDRDFDTNNDAHVTKMLVLGDSFAEGMGAPQDSTWPHLLENLLNQQDSSKYRVYNCGAAGSDPFFEYVMLRDKWIKLKPDKVIMSINYSDINDYITRGGMERFRPDGTVAYNKGPWFEPLYKRSHVARLFVHFILRYDFSLLSPSEHADKVKEALDKIADCAASARELCKSKNIAFLVVLHPYIDPYDRYLKKQDQLPLIEKLLRKGNIEVINLFEDFAKRVNESNYQTYSWPRDMHYTSQGYDLFAHLLWRRINTDYPDLLKKQTDNSQPAKQ